MLSLLARPVRAGPGQALSCPVVSARSVRRYPWILLVKRHLKLSPSVTRRLLRRSRCRSSDSRAGSRPASRAAPAARRRGPGRGRVARRSGRGHRVRFAGALRLPVQASASRSLPMNGASTIFLLPDWPNRHHRWPRRSRNCCPACAPSPDRMPGPSCALTGAAGPRTCSPRSPAPGSTCSPTARLAPGKTSPTCPRTRSPPPSTPARTAASTATRWPTAP